MTEQTREALRAVFTVEDREKISELLELGHRDMIAAEIDIQNQAQEAALQMLLNELRPAVNPEGSKVRAEMERRIAAGENLIESPEDEAKWQARIDAEAKGEPVEMPASVALEGEQAKASTKEEIIAELEKLEVDFDPNAKKADLKKLLEAARS